MKKFFEYIGLLSLMSFSFFLTNKTVDVAKNMDDIMIQIKDNKDTYKVLKEEAEISDDYFIPGIFGYEVNVNKSYKHMKKVGVYDPSLYIYDDIKVSSRIKDNLDKYIKSGNKNKNMVSIVIFFDKNNIDNLLKKIGNTKISFVVNYENLLNDKDILNELITKGHNIIINSSDSIDLYISFLNNKPQEKMFCLNTNMDNDFKNKCLNNQLISLGVNKINKQYLYNVKKNLLSGTIFVFDGNVLNEINTIINYIESKGFIIDNLNEHLKEER